MGRFIFFFRSKTIGFVVCVLTLQPEGCEEFRNRGAKAPGINGECVIRGSPKQKLWRTMWTTMCTRIFQRVSRSTT